MGIAMIYDAPASNKTFYPRVKREREGEYISRKVRTICRREIRRILLVAAENKTANLSKNFLLRQTQAVLVTFRFDCNSSEHASVKKVNKKKHTRNTPKCPMIDFSRPDPTVLVLSKRSVAISPMVRRRVLTRSFLLDGILSRRGSTGVSNMARLLYIDELFPSSPNDSKTLTIGDSSSPSMAPKSCENPAIPMLSRLKESKGKEIWILS